jgi:hypothetical protein
VFIVAWLTALFFAVLTVLNWVLADRRHAALAGLDRVTARDYAAAIATAPPTSFPFSPFQPLAFLAEPPRQQPGTLLIYVAVQTAVFLAVAVAVAVLVRRGRTGVALLAVGAAVVSIVGDGGLLSRVTPPIRSATDLGSPTPPWPHPSAAARAAWTRYANDGISFATPLWWRLVVAAGVLALLAVGVVLLRRGADTTAASERLRFMALAAASVPVFGFLAMFGGPDADGIQGADHLAFGVLVSTSLLGIALVVAGATARGRAGLLTALGLTALVAVAGLATWWTARLPGGSPQVYGFLDMGADPPSAGTTILWEALLASAPAGWAVAEALRRSHSPRRAPASKPA